MFKNTPSNAVDLGPTPGSGTKISYALDQLSPHTATKTQCSQNKKKSKIKVVCGPPDLMGQGFWTVSAQSRGSADGVLFSQCPLSLDNQWGRGPSASAMSSAVPFWASQRNAGSQSLNKEGTLSGPDRLRGCDGKLMFVGSSLFCSHNWVKSSKIGILSFRQKERSGEILKS